MPSKVPKAPVKRAGRIVESGRARYHSLGPPEFGASEVSTMFRRFAFVAALLAFVGIVPGHGVAVSTASGQVAIVADPPPPRFSTENAVEAHYPKSTSSNG